MKKLTHLVPLCLAFSTFALAASYTGVAVTGYNYDGIVERTATAPYTVTAQSLDASNHALFEIGLPSTTAGGLPQGGVLAFTSNGNSYSFQLGPYGNGSTLSNNLLRINPSATLTVTTPAPYTTLAVLGFTTENGLTGSLEMVGDATLHFGDGSSTVYAQSVDLPDWYASSSNLNIASSAAGGRVTITAGTAAAAFSATPGGPNFYVSLINLNAADKAKNLTSVTFGNFPFGGNTFQFVMGINGFNPAVIPPPPPPPPATAPALSTWALAALGIMLVTMAAATLRPRSQE